jgi:hypothetical protein
MLAEAIDGCVAPSAPGGTRDDDDDDADEDISVPNDPEAPEPVRSAPVRDPLLWQPLVADLVRRLPTNLIANVARGAVDRLEGAGHEMAGAVSPPRAEPTLGVSPEEAPSKGGRRERRSR